MGVSKSRGSGRVGSRTFQVSHVGSSRDKRLTNIAGRVGSRGFENARVRWGRVKRCGNLAGPYGSGHDPRPRGHSRIKSPYPAGCFWLSTDRTGGSGLRIRLFQTYSCVPEGPCCAGARGQDPRIRPVGPKMIQNLPLPARKPLTYRYSDRMLS